MLEACRDPLSGFFVLADELTGQPMLGIQFWQLDHHRPLNIRLFELDGISLLRQEGDSLRVTEAKRPYVIRRLRDFTGERVEPGPAYDRLPLIPLYANA